MFHDGILLDDSSGGGVTGVLLACCIVVPPLLPFRLQREPVPRVPQSVLCGFTCGNPFSVPNQDCILSAVIHGRGKRCSICSPILLRRSLIPAWAMTPRILSTFPLPARVVESSCPTARHLPPPATDPDADPGRASCGSRAESTTCWCPGVGPTGRGGPQRFSSLYVPV